MDGILEIISEFGIEVAYMIMDQLGMFFIGKELRRQVPKLNIYLTMKL